ncbi:hypothetical protein O181_004351 [Austropuccinia psidii MF-1]|uniref:STB6-like N-terminal domain-containing protein n=1 Tax=Austropuccinia psidii MF-1 TaxID=1389203 RepID=A0A9Q3GEY1_9BASI|nr:hypothetical protein [Austropuccinia psidii MF-1]
MQSTSTSKRSNNDLKSESSTKNFDLLISSFILTLKLNNFLPEFLSKNFHLIKRNLKLKGFEIYIVEQLLIDRSVLNPTLIVQADPNDQILVDVFRLKEPDQSINLSQASTVRDESWQDVLERLCQIDDCRPYQTSFGTILVKSLKSVRNDYLNLIKIDIPSDIDNYMSYDSIKDQLYCNIDMRRMQFGGRTGLDLKPCSSSQQKKFLNSFLIPQTDLANAEFRQLVFALINLVQAGLSLFGLGPLKSSIISTSIRLPRGHKKNTQTAWFNRENITNNSKTKSQKDTLTHSPLIRMDGLLCRETLEGLIEWRRQFDWSEEIPATPVFNPYILALLLSTILFVHQRLTSEGCRKLPSDPFRAQHRFLTSWFNYQIANEIEPELFLTFHGLQELLEISGPLTSPSPYRRRFPRPKAFGRFNDSMSSPIKMTSNLKELLQQLADLFTSSDKRPHIDESSSSHSSATGIKEGKNVQTHGLHLHSLYRIWFSARPWNEAIGMDKETREPNLGFSTRLEAQEVDRMLAGPSKTFLKPLVRGVASAGRSVGAGIQHAGKVVDAITDLTERITLPRNPGLLNTTEMGSNSDFGGGAEERREKFRRTKGVLKKAGLSVVPTSDPRVESSIPQNHPQLSSLDIYQDNLGAPTDGSSSHKRYGRSHTDHIGYTLYTEEDEARSANLDKELTKPTSAAFQSEAIPVLINTNKQSIRRVDSNRRRHSIQVPLDYDHITVRHTTKKQKLEVQLVWRYYELKRTEEWQKRTIQALEELEEVFHSTAHQAELKARNIKDHLDLYKIQTHNTCSTSVRPGDTNQLQRNRQESLSKILPQNAMAKRFVWEQADATVVNFYKDLISTGEVLRQRRHEVSHKLKMLDEHVEELMRQTGMMSMNSSEDKQGESKQIMGITESKAGARKTGYDGDKVVEIVEELIQTISEDPSLKIGRLMDIISEWARMLIHLVLNRMNIILKWWIEIVLMVFQSKLENWSEKVLKKVKKEGKESHEENYDESSNNDDDDGNHSVIIAKRKHRLSDDEFEEVEEEISMIEIED